MIARLALLIAVAFLGCSGPRFTNLGNGVGVPSESIDNYAKANGLSRDEARQKMLEEELGQKRQAEGQ